MAAHPADNLTHCRNCHDARSLLTILLHLVVRNDELDLVAADKDNAVVPFSNIYIACGKCNDTGVVPKTAADQDQPPKMPPQFPSSVSQSRLDAAPAGEEKPSKAKQKEQPK